MRKAALAVAVVLALLLLAALALPLFLPLEVYRSQIVSRVSEATGRELRVDGAMSLSVFPRLELELADVGLSGATGGRELEMLRLEHLRVALRLRPLLSGQVVVTSLELDRPFIRVALDEEGTSNWSGVGWPGRTGTSAAAADDVSRIAEAMARLTLDDVRIVDGTLAWIDARRGDALRASGIDLHFALPDLDAPFEAEGELVWKEERVSMAIAIERPRLLFEDGATTASAILRTDKATLRYAGAVERLDPAAMHGEVDLEVPSLRDLAVWLRGPIETPPDTFGPLSLHGKLRVDGSKLTLDDARIALDAIEAAGALGVEIGGARPHVNGRLGAARLDLRPYFPSAAGDSPGAGKTPREWSDKPIEADGLRDIDATLHLEVGTLDLHRLRVGKAVVDLELKSGRLAIDLREVEFHEGGGTVRLLVDAGTPGEVAIDLEAGLEGVQAGTLLRDTAGSSRLTGRGTIDLDVHARGQTQRDLVRTLQGRGRLDLRDGSIRGINLVAMVMHVASAFTLGDPSASTEFSSLGGSFRIDGGVLTNGDMQLRSSLLEAAGAGTVDLNRRTVAYRVTPRVLTPLVGQLGFGTPSVAVPVRIRGPWHNLRYEPDLKGMVKLGLQAPGNLLEGVLKIPGALRDAHKGESPEDTPKTERSGPAEMLKRLFRR